MSTVPRPRKDRRHRSVPTPLALAAFCAAALFASPPAGAQDLDDLDDLDEGVVLEEVFEPGVEPNTWEISASFGQADFAQDLLESHQAHRPPQRQRVHRGGAREGILLLDDG